MELIGESFKKFPLDPNQPVSYDLSFLDKLKKEKDMEESDDESDEESDIEEPPKKSLWTYLKYTMVACLLFIILSNDTLHQFFSRLIGVSDFKLTAIKTCIFAVIYFLFLYKF